MALSKHFACPTRNLKNKEVAKHFPFCKKQGGIQKISFQFYQYPCFYFVGVGFLIWYAITKHWALIPVFLNRRSITWWTYRIIKQKNKNHPEKDIPGKFNHVREYH